MFKSLKDRLKGVSSRLEDELEAELEAKLDAELAAEMAASSGAEAGAPAGEAETAAQAKPSQTAPQAEPEPPEPEPAEPKRPVPEPDRPEPERPEPERPEPEPPEPKRPVPEPDRPEPEPAEPERPEPEPDRPEPEPPEPERPDPQPPEPEPPEPERPDPQPPEPPEPEPREPPKPEPPRPPGPDPARATQDQAPRARAPQPTGRKMLSEQEIEARLQRELDEAVEVQRDVETVVRGSGAKLTRYTINEDTLDEILWELEIGLLESDVALPVIEAIKENVRDQLLSMSVAGKSAHDVVEKVLRTAVRRVLNVGHFDFDAFVDEKLKEKRPVVVMFVGVNGTGKTTSIARIAWRLKQRGISPVLAAGDTFRAGAIEQLSQHGDVLGVKVVKHSAGADPAAVAYDAIEHAKARRKDVVLLDTAGRMQTNTNLMDEMDKIRRVANPDLVVFVGDSLAGNDAVEQARRFDTVVDIDGAILTKTDVDAKGGAALSVAYTINKPLLFVGVGQDYPDLKAFDVEWMVDRLFGAEDVAEATAEA